MTQLYRPISFELAPIYPKMFVWANHFVGNCSSIITKCSGVCEESMYSTGLAPSILIFGLDQAFVLRIGHKVHQKELLDVMEFFHISITGNDDIGPVVATRDIHAHAIVL